MNSAKIRQYFKSILASNISDLSKHRNLIYFACLLCKEIRGLRARLPEALKVIAKVNELGEGTI